MMDNEHMLLALLVLCPSPQQIVVKDRAGLYAAVQGAKPGTAILLEPGTYQGGIGLANLHGTAERPIVIRARDPKNPPKITGGGSALQLSEISYVEIRDLVIEKPDHNGLNIDDGGTYDSPSHHVTIANLVVTDMPRGNNDGIKLSGLDDFKVENCRVERWGGSGVDMVGCHRGLIVGSKFLNGENGVQCKGGTSEVTIRSCRFEGNGDRAINIGGSTGLEYFRPPIKSIPAGKRYEARGIIVEGSTFIGGNAPFAFVGVDGARVRYNTIYHPNRWVMRILQETATPDFIPSRNGAFERNLVVFRSDRWFEGGVNIGPNTAPATFVFADNFWFCSDRPDRSRPRLPSDEGNSIYGKDPMLTDPDRGDLTPRKGSPAAAYGAGAFLP